MRIYKSKEELDDHVKACRAYTTNRFWNPQILNPLCVVSIILKSMDFWVMIVQLLVLLAAIFFPVTWVLSSIAVCIFGLVGMAKNFDIRRNYRKRLKEREDNQWDDVARDLETGEVMYSGVKSIPPLQSSDTVLFDDTSSDTYVFIGRARRVAVADAGGAEAAQSAPIWCIAVTTFQQSRTIYELSNSYDISWDEREKLLKAHRQKED